MPEIYCYHCGRHHPSEEMRQIEAKGRKKWRCIKSIDAAKQNMAQREAFGQTVTSINRAESQSRAKTRENIERFAVGR